MSSSWDLNNISKPDDVSYDTGRSRKILSSLALMLNVCLQENLCENNTEKIIFCQTINRAFESIKGIFSNDRDNSTESNLEAEPVVLELSPQQEVRSGISTILAKFIEDSKRLEDRSLCKNMVKITSSRNWLVARTFGHYGEFSNDHQRQEFLNAANTLMKLKKYLQMQRHRIKSISSLVGLKSLSPPKHDKSVQCSKSTEFLKDPNDHKFVSPSVRVESAEIKKRDHQLEYFELRKKSCSQPHLNTLTQQCRNLRVSRTPSRRSLPDKRRVSPDCPHPNRCESHILASVKRRIDEDFGGPIPQAVSANSQQSSARSGSFVTACESMTSINHNICRICENELIRGHCLVQCCYHHCCCNNNNNNSGPKTITLVPIKSSTSCDFPSNTTYGYARKQQQPPTACNKSCCSVDSGVELLRHHQDSDDESQQTRVSPSSSSASGFFHTNNNNSNNNKKVQADLVSTQPASKTASTETISSAEILDIALNTLTENLILCERRAKATLHRKQLLVRSPSALSDRSSGSATWNNLKRLKSSSEDELISGISTPSLVSLSDQEDEASSS